MTFQHSPFNKHWVDQYYRMKRWYNLLEKTHKSNQVDDGQTINYMDIVYAFFQNCYHLKDWIKNDNLKTNDEVERFINENDCMKICADLCNGSKHYTFNKPLRSGSDIVIEPTFRPIEKRIIPELGCIFSIDGFEYDPLSLGTECIKKWDEFLETLA